MSNSLNSWQEFLHQHGGQGYTREELVHMYHQQQGDPSNSMSGSMSGSMSSGSEGNCPSDMYYRHAYVRSDGTHVAGECVHKPHYSKSEKAKCPPGKYYRSPFTRRDGTHVAGECVSMPHYSGHTQPTHKNRKHSRPCPAGTHWRSGYDYEGTPVAGECIEDPHYSSSEESQCPPGKYYRSAFVRSDGTHVAGECVSKPHYKTSSRMSSASRKSDPPKSDPPNSKHSCPPGKHWRSGYRYAKNGAYVPGECIENPHYTKAETSQCPPGKYYRPAFVRSDGTHVAGECVHKATYSSSSDPPKSKSHSCGPNMHWRSGYRYDDGSYVPGECVHNPT